MNLWLFYRLILRRLLYSPLRLGLLVAALSLSTSLWLAVSYVATSGVRSFEQSLGLGPKEFPLVVTPASGRFNIHTLRTCLGPLYGKYEIVAVRRELGVVDARSDIKVVRTVGVSNSVITSESDDRIIETGDVGMNKKTLNLF